jgi:ABC-type dipeptide/oligopeptide/nickel transport system ATPase subunit
VLVTGPTGSGKSTIPASLVDLAREREDHIMTVEDLHGDGRRLGDLRPQVVADR